MRSEYSNKFNPDLVEMNEKLRRETMRAIEPHGRRGISELPEMSELERCKWFFWNMHENLDEFRRLEPSLVGEVLCTKLTVKEGLPEEGGKIEKRLSLHCRWYLHLVYSAFQNEEMYQIGEGSVDLLISDTPPTHPSLQKNQKGYIDSDNSLYPNQLFTYGWLSEALWGEVKEHFYSASPNMRAELVVRDNCIYPVKAGFDFVVGPPGAVGITNMEFRIASYSVERRTTRRSETLER